MKTLTIRNIEDEVYQKFAQRAAANHRAAEAHGRFLIYQDVTGPLETCGEILDSIFESPAPGVSEAEINKMQNSRGRRSNRP